MSLATLGEFTLEDMVRLTILPVFGDVNTMRVLLEGEDEPNLQSDFYHGLKNAN